MPDIVDQELETLMAQDSSRKKKKKKNWNKKKLVLIAGCLLAVGAFVVLNGRQGKAPAGPVVATAPLTRGTVEEKLTVSGPVSGTDSAEVVSKLHAEILEILVKEGDQVEEGQVLARLDREDTAKEVEIARNSYDLAVSNLDKAQRDVESGYEKAVQDYQTAKVNFERSNALYQAGSVPKTEWETAKNTLEDTKRQVNSYTVVDGKPVADESYSLEVQNRKFALEQQEKLLTETEVTSPIRGTVVRVNSKVGRFADIVDDDKPLFEINNLETLEMKINVSEYSIGKVRVGQTAAIRADILNGEVEEGRVVSISPTGEEKGGGSSERVIPTTIEILGKETKLIAGITAKAEIVLEKAENAWVVPISAVFQKEGQSYLAATENGVVRLIPVDTGVESDIQIQVTEQEAGALTEGMNIIQAVNASFTDGMAVTVPPTT